MAIQSKTKPSLDEVCVLLAESTVRDAIGSEVTLPAAEREVWCAETPCARADFAAARQVGLTLEKVLIVDSSEYQGEEKVRFDDLTLSVYRIYARPDELTELQLVRKAGVRHAGNGG